MKENVKLERAKFTGCGTQYSPASPFLWRKYWNGNTILPTKLGNKYFLFCERNIRISVKEILEWKHHTSNKVGKTYSGRTTHFHSAFRTISRQRIASSQNGIYQYLRSWCFGLRFSLGVTKEIYTFLVQADRIWAKSEGKSWFKGFPTVHTYLQLAHCCHCLGGNWKTFWIWFGCLKGNNWATGDVVNDGTSDFHCQAEKALVKWK